MHPAGPSSSPPRPYAMPPYPPQHPGPYHDYGAYQQQQPQQLPMYPPQFIPPYQMMWPHPPPPHACQHFPPQYPQLPPQPPHGRPYQPRGQGGYRGGRGRRPNGAHMGPPFVPRGMMPMLTSPVGPTPAQPPISVGALPPPPMTMPSGPVGAFYQPIPTPPSPPESLLPPTPQPESSSSPSPQSGSTVHTTTPTSPISVPEIAPSPNRTPKATPPTIASVLQALPDAGVMVHIARYRPTVDTAGIITIARHLTQRESFPKMMLDNAVIDNTPRPKISAALKPRRPVPTSVVVTPAPTTPSSVQVSLTSAAVSSLPTTPGTTTVKTPSVISTSSAQAPPSVTETQPTVTETREETPKPAPAPKPKPSSWAGLFRPSGTPSTAATAPAIKGAGIHAHETSNVPTVITLPSSPIIFTQADSVVTREEPVRRRPAAKVDLERLVADGTGILDEVLKQGENWRAALTVPMGLWNTGNLCFANCILQTLVYCGPFYELVTEIGQRIGGAVGGRTPFLDAMVLFLRQIPITTSPDPWKARLDEVDFPGLGGPASEAAKMEVIKQKESQGMVPDYVYNGLSDYPKSKQILKGGQEDVDEFFCFLLDVLEEELLTVLKIFSANPTPASASSTQASFGGKKLTPGKPDDEFEVRRPVSPGTAARGAEDGEWTEVGKRNKKVVSRSILAAETAITKLFCLKTRTVDRRPGAKDAVLIEPQQRLSLSVIDEKITNIEQALHAFASVETMEGTNLSRQVMLDTLPPVLVLQLQRWGPRRNGRWEKTEKEIAITQILEIPNEALSPARRSAILPKYRLFAVLYHDGLSAQQGHYTLDVLRQDCSEWIHYDNEQISLASPPGEEKLRDGRVAYMLYYLRIV
ncbi:cysteine proteinase [Dacryopinax primogenitus]|uniref:Ubiquitin carboxyl-terminal hydrolase n=1 Tax=Dacryopinax primogenitus (strain DJM 731) TaxID=1858805 RepID=M5FRV0_DACPD|nr:cysteine proteinase [Dacryopinax primogenitus]EJT98483.1 cysteine proteinase [Dacryopinax primogenitus]